MQKYIMSHFDTLENVVLLQKDVHGEGDEALRCPSAS